MGLACTRFASPERDRRRAATTPARPTSRRLARAVLRQPRLRAHRAPAVGRSCRSRSRAASSTSTTTTRSLRARLPRHDGRQDGLHATPPGAAWWPPRGAARRRLGVVLLHSPDPGRQARRLLDAGFARRPLTPPDARRTSVEDDDGPRPSARPPAARPTTCGSPPAPGVEHGARRRASTPSACATARCPGATSPTSSLDCELLGARARRAAAGLGDDGRDRARRRQVNRRLAARRGRARHRARARLGPARCSTTRRCCRPTGPRARRGRRCCSPTSAPRRCAAPAAPARAERLVELLDADGLIDPPQPGPGGGPARGRAATSPACWRGSPAIVGAARAAAGRRQGGRLRDGRRRRRARSPTPASRPSTSPARAGRTGR